MTDDERHTLSQQLRAHGIRPSAQRLVIASYVLRTTQHPSADRVHDEVRAQLPDVSRATIYNTLNLFADVGLLRRVTLTAGHVVFDPNMEPHHHLIDDRTGKIHDIPWAALRVVGTSELDDFVVEEHQVVLRGRRKSP